MKHATHTHQCKHKHVYILVCTKKKWSCTNGRRNHGYWLRKTKIFVIEYVKTNVTMKDEPPNEIWVHHTKRTSFNKWLLGLPGKMAAFALFSYTYSFLNSLRLSVPSLLKPKGKPPLYFSLFMVSNKIKTLCPFFSPLPNSAFAHLSLILKPKEAHPYCSSSSSQFSNPFQCLFCVLL